MTDIVNKYRKIIPIMVGVILGLTVALTYAAEPKKATKSPLTWEEVAKSNDINKYAIFLKENPRTHHLGELTALCQQWFNEKISQEEKGGKTIIRRVEEVPVPGLGGGAGTRFTLLGGQLKLGSVLWYGDPIDKLKVEAFPGKFIVHQGKGIAIIQNEVYTIGF